MDRLYYAPGAASFLVHWLLIECDAPHELVRVDIAAGQQKSPEYLALNPNGVVPTLVMDGTPRFEAAALAMTLGDRYPETGLAPPPGDSRRPDYVQWMFHLANAVQPLFRLWWYPDEPAGPENDARVRDAVTPRIEAAWQRLDDHLAQHGPYLLGDRPTIADFYLAMLMRWSRNMPRPAMQWPHLATLARNMTARDSFRALYAREGLSEWP